IGDRHMIDTPHDVDLQIISGARKPELVCRDTAGKIEFTGWPRIAGEAIDNAVLTATAPELIVIIAAAALQQIVAGATAQRVVAGPADQHVIAARRGER